jgi:predicted permease
MLITRIFIVLFPVFTIILAGYFYARFRSFDMSSANRLNMEIFSPALLFTVLSDHSFNLFDYQSLTLAALLILLGSGLIVLPLVRWLKIQEKTFIPSMMFVNTGNIGIPVALFAFGEPGLPAALLFFMITTLANFSLGIYIMNHRAPWFKIFQIPLVQAALVGLVINMMSVEIPQLLLTPVEMLGQCAIPIMLFSLGVRLTQIDLTHWRIGLLGAVVRPLVGTLLFLLIRPWFTLTPIQASGLLIFAVLPPAIINYIIAEQYQQEPHQVAAIVMLGNLGSFISLPIALAFAL